MNFIITSLTSWDEVPRARHQVADELIRAGHHVVFVEKNRGGRIGVQIKQEKTGLTLVSPGFLLDYRFRYRIPIFNELYQLWLFRLLRHKFGEQLVINFDYTAHLLDLFFQNTIYYCNDEYIGTSRYPLWLINRYQEIAERRVVRNACFCVGTARHLIDKLERFNEHVYHIPLGGPNPDEISASRSYKERGHIDVVLMGEMILGHVSYEICNKIAEREDMTLTLIGNVDSGFEKKLRQPQRIKRRGVLKGSTLYRELSTFDVAVAPYDLERVNAGVTPNKLFQYLACLCPVVVSNIPNIRGIEYPPGTAYVAADSDDFIALIREAYREDCPEYARVRREYAAQNTWNQRIQSFLLYLEKHNLLRSS